MGESDMAAGVRVYWLDARGVDPGAPEALALMSPRRLAKLAALPLAAERRRGAAAELALALGMARERHRAPEPVTWRRGVRGKPEPPEGWPRFSLSHAADAAVCAICERPVGVDVERERPIRPALRRWLLSPEEADCPDDMLLAKWVAKESYLKLTGEGVSRPMRGFSAAGGRIAAGGSTLARICAPRAPWAGYELCVCTEEVQTVELIEIEWPARAWRRGS